DVAKVVKFADFENAGDVEMVERLGCSSGALKTATVRRIQHRMRGCNLQRNLLPVACIHGAVDDSADTFAEVFLQVEDAELTERERARAHVTEHGRGLAFRIGWNLPMFHFSQGVPFQKRFDFSAQARVGAATLL